MEKIPNNIPNNIVLRNKRILLVRRPNGLPRPDDFRLEEQSVVVAVANDRRAPAHPSNSHSHSHSGDDLDQTGTLVLETLFVSIDPAMRGWMSTAKSYLPPVRLGSVMRASTVSRVLSVCGDELREVFPIGAVVRSEIVGVQLDTATASTRFPPANTQLSFASYLGVLGTTGLTAYFGLLRVGRPGPSDTVLVSGAAGATGSIVAQIAKHVVGCKRVIGTAGTDEKCAWLESNRIVDVAINYRTTKSLSRAIRDASSGTSRNDGGVDLVFDNVGSEFLEAALSNLSARGGARVVLCGAISQYNHNKASASTATGPRNYMNLLVKRASMKGFVVFDYQSEYPAAIRDLVRWISEGKIPCYKEDMRHVGVEHFYPALVSLFTGTNVGKVVLKINEKQNANGNGNGNGNDEYRSHNTTTARSKL
eukprot:jgi/Psemu1/213251/e_gw1.633.10.1